MGNMLYVTHITLRKQGHGVKHSINLPLDEDVKLFAYKHILGRKKQTATLLRVAEGQRINVGAVN
jgi:hypothetical protein